MLTYKSDVTCQITLMLKPDHSKHQHVCPLICCVFLCVVFVHCLERFCNSKHV